MHTLGSRIRAAREQLNLTVEKLAALSGISKGFLSEVENGKANITIVRGLRIAEALGVSLDFLATGNEKPYVCPFCNGTGVL